MLLANRNGIRYRIDLLHIHRLSQRNAQAFSLTHRIIDDPVMRSHNRTVRIDECPFGILFSRISANKRRVIPIGHKTNVLALCLLGIDETMLHGQLTHLLFRHAAQRKKRMGKLLLRKQIQHITLVLRLVRGFFQQVLLAIVFDLRIMAGHQIIAAQLMSAHEQLLEFQIMVAIDARIRRFSLLI